MSAARRERLVRIAPLLVGAVVILLMGPLFILKNAEVVRLDQRGIALVDFVWAAAVTAISVSGTLILTRKPRHAVGWSLTVFGVGFAISIGLSAVTVALAEADKMSAAAALEGVSTGLIGAIFMLIPAALFLFPTGSPPSPRWRPVVWIMVIAAGIGFFGGLVNLEFFGGPSDDTFFGPGPLEESLGGVADALSGLGFLLVFASGVATVASLIVRFRRSEGEERLQLKWIAAAFLFFASGVALVAIEGTSTSVNSPSGVTTTFPEVFVALGLMSVPVAMGIAILKYRLYDIDIVISRSLTYGALAAFITGVYALVVVGIGTLVGGESDLVLSIAAVAIVAVAFEPLRSRLQRWANRLVFGERATPYEVLSQATARLADSDSPEESLERVTQLVVDGTGAAEAVLWLKVGQHLQPQAATPPSSLEGVVDVAMAGEDLPVLPGDAYTPVQHRGEILGALSISKQRGEAVTGVDAKMLDDIASGTGLRLRNIGLNEELAARADQLHASRRRLVAAHDAERHRLERDLHDGAQQLVVAIKVKLGIARILAQREGATDVESLVSSLADVTQEAVDSMRAVAHGIYPPLLEAEGLEAALKAARRTFAIRVDLEIDGIGRYERSVEESLYFCSIETVTKAVDGGASWCLISLTGTSDSVRFTVRHDGVVRTLVSVSDRVEAFGGRLDVDREASDGVVTGELPITDSLVVTA